MPTYEERLLLSEDGPLIFENQGVENQNRTTHATYCST